MNFCSDPLLGHFYNFYILTADSADSGGQRWFPSTLTASPIHMNCI